MAKPTLRDEVRAALLKANIPEHRLGTQAADGGGAIAAPFNGNNGFELRNGLGGRIIVTFSRWGKGGSARQWRQPALNALRSEFGPGRVAQNDDKIIVKP